MLDPLYMYKIDCNYNEFDSTKPSMKPTNLNESELKLIINSVIHSVECVKSYIIKLVY